MKKCTSYFLMLCILLLSLACKKKTTIRVKVFNPALNENVVNARVVLIERKGEGGGGLFVAAAECEEIASAITDAKGECVFEKEKLRLKRDYFCAVTESWGISQGYPCAGKSSRFISKGGTEEWLLTDIQNGRFGLQYENLLQPSQKGDSLNIVIEMLKYVDPFNNETKGGGRPVVAFPSFGDRGFPYPPTVITPTLSCPGGKYTATVFKKKMGVVTTSTDTFKVYPNQLKTFVINW